MSKKNHVKISQDLLDWLKTNDSFLNNIITSDEMWMYGYDVETKTQLSQWVGKLLQRPKKACHKVTPMRK